MLRLNMEQREESKGPVCPHCSLPLAGSVWEINQHVEWCLVMNEGSYLAKEGPVVVEHENSNCFQELEWCGQKWMPPNISLEGGFQSPGFVMCSSKENPNSGVQLDVVGDDTQEYGKPQYTEIGVVSFRDRHYWEKGREALQNTGLIGMPPSTAITPEFSKWVRHEMPSTSSVESRKQGAKQMTCKNKNIEKASEDSAVPKHNVQKRQFSELERLLTHGNNYKCFVCMGSTSVPLTSIRCWHVYCETCWWQIMREKKQCPRCYMTTAPQHLRRIHL